MKELKVDLSMYEGKIREAVSVAIQEKAFEIGYEWSFGKDVFYKKSPYLFFDEGGIIKHLSDKRYFEDHSGAEISADDFLGLNLEPDFKPFDKVLVRDFDSEEWRVDFFDRISKDKPYRYQCLMSFWHQCVPYEGNEHLLGITKEA